MFLSINLLIIFLTLVKLNNDYKLYEYIDISYDEFDSMYDLIMFIYIFLFFILSPILSFYFSYNKILYYEHYFCKFYIINFMLWFGFITLISLLVSITSAISIVKIHVSKKIDFISKKIDFISKIKNGNNGYSIFTSSNFFAYIYPLSYINDYLTNENITYNLGLGLILSFLTFIFIVAIDTIDIYVIISIINLLIIIFSMTIFLSVYIWLR